MAGSFRTVLMHAVIIATLPANGDKRRARIDGGDGAGPLLCSRI